MCCRDSLETRVNTADIFFVFIFYFIAYFNLHFSSCIPLSILQFSIKTGSFIIDLLKQV